MKRLIILISLISLLLLNGCMSSSIVAMDGPIDTVVTNSFVFDIVGGKIDGYTTQFKFARSTQITTTESVLWDGGGNYVFLETAEKLNIVSTSPLDTLTGTGARTILVYGLDENYTQISELMIMNGTNIVTTENEYLRTYRMLVYTSGLNDPINDANQGDITATTVTTSTLQAKMLINNGQTLMSVFTVPANHTAYITGLSLSAGQGKECFFKAKFRNGPDSINAFSVKYAIDIYQGTFNTNLATPLAVPEKIDILITAQTTSGTISATASYGMVLIEG